MEMDVDGEDDGTQRAAVVRDYGLVVDFEGLDEDEVEVSASFFGMQRRECKLMMLLWEQDGSEEMEKKLLENVKKVEAEMEKMSPNAKAIERFVFLLPFSSPPLDLELTPPLLRNHQARRFRNSLQRNRRRIRARSSRRQGSEGGFCRDQESALRSLQQRVQSHFGEDRRRLQRLDKGEGESVGRGRLPESGGQRGEFSPIFLRKRKEADLIVVTGL